MKGLINFIEEQNQKIIEGVYDPGILKAFFTAGGPGSGKSFMAKQAGVGRGKGKELVNPEGLKIINSDDQFEKMLKDAGMAMNPKNIFSPKGQEIRQKAKEITKGMQQNYMDGRLGLLIDGTGKDFNKIKKSSDQLRGLGYDTFMLFVNTSLDVAQKRNMERARSLDPKEVEKMWNAVQTNIGKFQNYFGRSNFILVDNNDAGEDIFKKLYRQVVAMIRKPVKNPIGKKWIESELEKKRRS